MAVPYILQVERSDSDINDTGGQEDSIINVTSEQK